MVESMEPAMTTVLAVHNSSGCVGRCDANCHDAKHEKCTCICGGKNHGKGSEQAIRNVIDDAVGLLVDDLKQFATATKRDPKQLIVINRLKTPNARRARKIARYKLEQPDLFDERVP